MITKKQREDSKMDFGKFMSSKLNEDNAPVQIDDEMYFYFLEVLPPRKMTGYGFLVGEPYTHNSQGEGVYECFLESLNNKYFYAGLKTVKEFQTITWK